jgi:hypothetical protein
MRGESIDQYYDRLMHDPTHPIAVAGYHDAHLWSEAKRLLRLFEDADIHECSVWSRAKLALLEALHRFEMLPEDHPFWQQSSRRWTNLILDEHTWMPLDPQSKHGWWFRIALDLSYCPNDFSSDAWRDYIHSVSLRQSGQ